MSILNAKGEPLTPVVPQFMRDARTELYVCCACGKLSWDKYGEDTISSGWDESCMLKAMRVRKDGLVLNKSGTMVVEILEGGVIDDGLDAVV